MNFIKKILSGLVTFTTILSTVFVGSLSLSIGTAAAASAGDLIKASTPAVYYYAADGKRYVFPNEKTYFSWFKDFSSVKTISDADLANIMIGGNVTIRPGTKLVKITTDPKVYAVTLGGVLHWVQSEAVATALYGSNWAQRVVDVPDSFFVNYSVGSSIATDVHPDGSLISYSGSSDKYIVMGGQKRHFNDDSVFNANGLNAADVIQTSIQYPDGSPVAARESQIADVVYLGNVVSASGGVNVALASDTPAGMTLPKNSSSVPLAKFNLTAGSSDALLAGLSIHRVGVGATTDFSNVYLYDGNGNRLTTGRTINSQTNLVQFNSLNITIPAGQTQSFLIYGDLSSPATTGGQHAFEIADAGSVVLSGNGVVSGSFPVRGNAFTVGTASAGRLDVQKGTQPSNPQLGQTDAEISNFKLVANTNDIKVNSITLLQAGTVANSDLSNFVLYQGTTPVASGSSIDSLGHLKLTFNPPYVISNGNTKVFSLHAKVAGRSQRTIRTYVEYTTDVNAIDMVYGSGAAVCISNSQVGGCSSTGQGSFDGASASYYVEVTIQGGQLTVSFNGPPTSNVAKGTSGVVLFKFGLASQQNDILIKNMDFKIAGTGSPAGFVKGASGTEYFRNIKVVNLDTGTTIMGPVSMPSSVANSANTTGVFTLSDSFILKAGQALNLALESDLSNTEDSDTQFFTNGTSTYQVTMGDANSNLFGTTDAQIVSTGEYVSSSSIVPNTAITGNSFTVKASSLSVALASSPSSGTAVKKQKAVASAGFVLTAGAQSNITVSAITVTGSASTTASGYTTAGLASAVTACSLFDKDSGQQYGTSQNPDVTAGTMTFSSVNFPIPAGSSKTVIIKCDMATTFTNTNVTYALGIASGGVTSQDSSGNNITASYGSGVTTNASTSNQTVIQTIKANGSLTVATDSLRQSDIVVGDGTTWQNLSQFKATAQDEDIMIDRISVTSTNDAANYGAVAIALNGAVKGWDILPSGSFKNKDIDLTSSPITIPAGTSQSFQVWAKLNPTQASSSVAGATTGVSRSGNVVAAGLVSGLQTGEWDSNYANKFNVRATGLASGSRVYASSTNAVGGVVGNNFVLRKSKPIVTRQALSTTTLASGADLDLYKFQVAADPAGSISLKKIVFSLAFSTTTNSTLSLSNFRVRRGAQDLTTNQTRIINGVSGSDLTSGTLNSGAAASATARVLVEFTNEETISGSGNVYTLHATVGGTVNSGDSVTVSFFRTTSTLATTAVSSTTGYLTNDYVTDTTAINVGGPHIDTSVAPSNVIGQNGIGTFVWSDQSETPHSDAQGSAGGSRDWTNDIFVQDLTQNQSLAR